MSVDLNSIQNRCLINIKHTRYFFHKLYVLTRYVTETPETSDL